MPNGQVENRVFTEKKKQKNIKKNQILHFKEKKITVQNSNMLLILEKLA